MSRPQKSDGCMDGQHENIMSPGPHYRQHRGITIAADENFTFVGTGDENLMLNFKHGTDINVQFPSFDCHSFNCVVISVVQQLLF